MLAAPDHESPFDPNTPPTRPASALSGSGSSFVNASDEDEDDWDYVKSAHYMAPRLRMDVICRDDFRCLLCGSQDNLRVLRILGRCDPRKCPVQMQWMRVLKLVPSDCDRDSMVNLMTLCDAHATAYESSVWRFCPCAVERQILLSYRKDAEQRHSPMHADEAHSHFFDLLIFRPEEMPPLASPQENQENEVQVTGSHFNPPSNPSTCRVISSTSSLPVNPCIVFAAALEVAGCCYWPPPDDALELLECEQQCEGASSGRGCELLYCQFHWRAESLLRSLGRTARLHCPKLWRIHRPPKHGISKHEVTEKSSTMRIRPPCAHVSPKELQQLRRIKRQRDFDIVTKARSNSRYASRCLGTGIPNRTISDKLSKSSSGAHAQPHVITLHRHDRIRSWKASKTKGKKKSKKSPPRVVTQLMNSYNILTDELEIGAPPISTSFDFQDLCTDKKSKSGTDNASRINQAFTELESAAASVISVLEKARIEHRTSVSLTRAQVNTLRKFLFMIPYLRSRYQQFVSGDLDPHIMTVVGEYMRKHGLRDVTAAWLFSLRHMLEAEHWEIPNDERILSIDRQNYRDEMVDRHLVHGLIIPPFISMCMVGVPLHFLFDFNILYPITPHLIIFLRNVPLAASQRLHKVGISNPFPPLPPSYFSDLPHSPTVVTCVPPLRPSAIVFRHKPRVLWTPEDSIRAAEYTEHGLIDGKLQHARTHDVLRVALDELTAEQAGKVNTLLLGHCEQRIVFLTGDALVHAIERYEKNEDLVTRHDQATRFSTLKRKLKGDAEEAGVDDALKLMETMGLDE
ncbi:hypothetical protein EW146_g1869 [Bondarzewia mesenterica]|uniref:Uncharacterized protein n=1 Tax=Bondarzewia mesenterica TaxID=1095465 RepID=A0A4S4M2H9_9AGAM|nr:hypothetical protein EW146_g1869 [Bondarzewia mesenterica]